MRALRFPIPLRFLMSCTPRPFSMSRRTRSAAGEIEEPHSSQEKEQEGKMGEFRFSVLKNWFPCFRTVQIWKWIERTQENHRQINCFRFANRCRPFGIGTLPGIARIYCSLERIFATGWESEKGLWLYRRIWEETAQGWRDRRSPKGNRRIWRIGWSVEGGEMVFRPGNEGIQWIDVGVWPRLRKPTRLPINRKRPWNEWWRSNDAITRFHDVSNLPGIVEEPGKEPAMWTHLLERNDWTALLDAAGNDPVSRVRLSFRGAEAKFGEWREIGGETGTNIWARF